MLAGILGVSLIMPWSITAGAEETQAQTEETKAAEEGKDSEAAAADTKASETNGEAAAETEAAEANDEAAAAETKASEANGEMAAADAETAEAGAEEANAAEVAEQTTEAAEDTAGTGSAVSAADRDAIYQASFMQGLLSGYYDGVITVGELKEHGDTGFGVFDALDGEMIMVDGTVYRAASDSSVQTIEDDVRVPFADVTFFEADASIPLSGLADMQALQDALNEVVAENGRNRFYMTRIDGEFGTLQVRSESRQEKPYRPLTEALEADQVEFNYADIRGTIIGLYCPDFTGGVTGAGWNFSFISEGRALGGSVLEVSVTEASAALDVSDELCIYLPEDQEFQNTDFSGDIDIEAAEEADQEGQPEETEEQGTEDESNAGTAESAETRQERIEGSAAAAPTPKADDTESAENSSAESSRPEAESAEAGTEGAAVNETPADNAAAENVEAGTEETVTNETAAGSGSETAEAGDGNAEAAASADAKPAESEAGAGNGSIPASYIVQEGDTLYIIAEKFGLVPEEIAELNKELMINTAIENGYSYVGDYDYAEYIFPDEELVLPNGSANVAH